MMSKKQRRLIVIILVLSIALVVSVKMISKNKPEEIVTPTKTLEVIETPTPTPTPIPTVIQTPQPTTTEENGKWKSKGRFMLTAYCQCKKCCGKWAVNRPIDENGEKIVITASGARAQEGVTIAVDPRVIPYGTKVKINEKVYTAQDAGTRGKHIDIYFNDHQEALKFGRQRATVYVEVK